jgi:hypothetical protein
VIKLKPVSNNYNIILCPVSPPRDRAYNYYISALIGEYINLYLSYFWKLFAFDHCSLKPHKIKRTKKTINAAGCDVNTTQDLGIINIYNNLYL